MMAVILGHKMRWRRSSGAPGKIEIFSPEIRSIAAMQYLVLRICLAMISPPSCPAGLRRAGRLAPPLLRRGPDQAARRPPLLLAGLATCGALSRLAPRVWDWQ